MIELVSYRHQLLISGITDLINRGIMNLSKNYSKLITIKCIILPHMIYLLNYFHRFMQSILSDQ